ncbi:Apoptosis-inducing factor 2 [Fusarium oxysporum f. sp. albedinis]|nr:Apoptosis-inducing factor 2 [Fusarium oxysporum f. sp. albedinis]
MAFLTNSSPLPLLSSAVPTSHRIEPDSSKKDHQQGLLPILCVLCVSLAHPCLTVHLAPTASQGPPPGAFSPCPDPCPSFSARVLGVQAMTS